MTCKECGGPLVHCWRCCMRRLVCLLIVICSTVTATAQVYRIETVSHRSSGMIRGTGTAVCIGHRGNTGLFLTAKHNLASIESFVVRGDSGPAECYRISLHPTDDIAAFCARGDFRPMPMSADEIPDGAPVQVCGFGPAAHGTPDQFCFAASIYGQTLTSKSHVIPGDSGGAAYVGLGEEHVLVGIVSGYYPVPGSGYSRRRDDGKGKESIIVPIATVAEWLPTQYSNCPSCIPLRQPRPLQQRGQIRYRGAPPLVSVPQPAPVPSPPSQVIIAPCQDDLRQLVAEYLAAHPPASGRDGQRGPAGRDGADAVVDYRSIIEAVVAQLPPAPAGPQGPAGPPGERGLVGVPDDQDIQNWLLGAMSNPEVRQQMAILLADIVSEDARVDALIGRIDALEKRKHSQRVLLVDGSRDAVLDDETYTDEPIVLDVRKFRGPSR